MDTIKITLPPVPKSQSKSTILVSTASSDGKIRLYDLAALPADLGSETPQLTAISEYDTKGSRLTCMTLADGDVSVSAVAVKRKRDSQDDEDDADDTEAEDASAGFEKSDGEGDGEEGEDEDEDEAVEDADK